MDVKKLRNFLFVGLPIMAVIGILTNGIGSSIAFAFAISACFTLIALSIKLWDDITFYKTFEGKAIIGISIFNIATIILVRIWGNKVMDAFGVFFIFGVIAVYVAILLYKAGILNKILK